MSNLHVIEIKDGDLRWGFDGGHPNFSVVNGTYGGAENVDPFPAYAHDVKLVEEELTRVASIFPLDFDVYLYVSNFESISRTNAHASPGYDYQAETDEFGHYPISTGTIVLSGKRIPLHPAMTRYLVSHEYGHLVQYRLERARLLDMKEYAKLRGIENQPTHYGGRTWHLSPGEIFANDFRILVSEREVDFWPHKAVDPRDVPELIEWWKKTESAFDNLINKSH